MGETNDPTPPFVGNTERMAENLNKERYFMEQKKKTYSQSPTLEDFARIRESSKNLESLEDSDLRAAAEMVRAMLEAIQREHALRTAPPDEIA
jgi:hypothetical protein